MPHCSSAPQMGEVRDKPIVSYVGDTALITCKMEDTKPPPTTWIWYKANGTEKVCQQLSGLQLSTHYSFFLFTVEKLTYCLALGTLKGNNSNLNFPFNFKRLFSVLLNPNTAHEDRNHTETIQVQGGKCMSSLLCTCRSEGVQT